MKTYLLARWAHGRHRARNLSSPAAHSRGSSSSSRVKNLGLSLKDIQKAVGWLQSSTFRKFYILPFEYNYGTILLEGHPVTQ